MPVLCPPYVCQLQTSSHEIILASITGLIVLSETGVAFVVRRNWVSIIGIPLVVVYGITSQPFLESTTTDVLVVNHSVVGV